MNEIEQLAKKKYEKWLEQAKHIFPNTHFYDWEQSGDTLRNMFLNSARNELNFPPKQLRILNKDYVHRRTTV